MENKEDLSDDRVIYYQSVFECSSYLFASLIFLLTISNAVQKVII